MNIFECKQIIEGFSKNFYKYQFNTIDKLKLKLVKEKEKLKKYTEED